MVMQWWQIHQPKQITNERQARKIKEPNKSVRQRKKIISQPENRSKHSQASQLNIPCFPVS